MQQTPYLNMYLIPVLFRKHSVQGANIQREPVVLRRSANAYKTFNKTEQAQDEDAVRILLLNSC